MHDILAHPGHSVTLPDGRVHRLGPGEVACRCARCDGLAVVICGARCDVAGALCDACHAWTAVTDPRVSGDGCDACGAEVDVLFTSGTAGCAMLCAACSRAALPLVPKGI